MKKPLILLSIICIGFVMQAKSQNTSSSYKTAVGAKVYFGDGTLGGLNIKHFLNKTAALEGSLLFQTGAIYIEGLYEYHGDITSAPGLKWYAGGGGIIGFSTAKNSSNDFLFGIRGALGIDYKINGAPIDVAFDLNPTITLAPSTDFTFAAGLAFRFAF